MANSTPTGRAESQAPERAYALRDIPVNRLMVSKNNPRKQFDEQQLDRLAHAMSTRGFDHPILVKPAGRDGYYEIIDGERRWRAAKHAAVKTIPALVKTRPSEPGSDLLDAMLANGLGISLDVIEEALGYQALISDAGYTRKGIAEAFKIPQARVRERLLILDLPEKLRHQVAAGIVPLSAVKTLASLVKIHPGLPEVAATRILDGPLQEWDEPTTWEDLAGDPISVLIGGYEEQFEDLPNDVFIAGYGYPVSRFDLDEKATKGLAKLCELLQTEPERAQVRFDRDLVEQARALNAAHLSANETEAIIVGVEVASQLACDHIMKCLESQRKRESAERERLTRVNAPHPPVVQRVNVGAGESEQAIQPPSDEQIEAGRKRALEEDRALRDRTIAANQRLGATLIKHCSKVKLDDRVLKILTAAPLSADLGRIAARGARLAFPGWAELSTRKNGSTKAEYLDYSSGEEKAREFLRGATSAAEIAGRTLALLAAARWAKEQHAVSNTNASGYTLKLASIIGDRGMPWREEAEELLDEILIEKLPPEVSDPIREAKEHRDAQRAEEERRERERDTVVAKFIELAPSLTRDERQSEIQRLRHEYGYGALPHEQGQKLMELPQPTSTASSGVDGQPDDDVSEEALALAA